MSDIRGRLELRVVKMFRGITMSSLLSSTPVLIRMPTHPKDWDGDSKASAIGMAAHPGLPNIPAGLAAQLIRPQHSLIFIA